MTSLPCAWITNLETLSIPGGPAFFLPVLVLIRPGTEGMHHNLSLDPTWQIGDSQYLDIYEGKHSTCTIWELHLCAGPMLSWIVACCLLPYLLEVHLGPVAVVLSVLYTSFTSLGNPLPSSSFPSLHAWREQDYFLSCCIFSKFCFSSWKSYSLNRVI